MAVIGQDWTECSCGSDEFIKQEIVVLPISILKRDKGEQTVQFPVLDNWFIYVCTKCGKQLDK